MSLANTVFGPALQVTGAKKFERFIYYELDGTLEGSWGCAQTPNEMANLIIDHIKKKRKDLGLVAFFAEKKDRVLYDMVMRRKIEIE